MSDTPAMRPSSVPVLDVKVIGGTPRIVDKGDDPDFDPIRDLPAGGAFDPFRHITTRQELREACELLQRWLALGSERRISVTFFARLMLRAAWAVMKHIDTNAGATTDVKGKTRNAIPPWPDSLNKASYYGVIKAAQASRDPEQFHFEARRRVLAAIEDVLRWCAGAGAKVGRSKRNIGRPRLRDADPKLQVYNRIRRERKPGERPAVVQERLEADRDFMELFEAAKLKWETVFHNADVYYYRPRRPTNKQQTPPP
jgi:hypothetical protein